MAAEQQIRNQESYQQRNLMQINNQKNDWENRKDEAETRIKSLKVRLDNLKEINQDLRSYQIILWKKQMN